MKKYPKVPRYDHPVVDDDIFNIDDIVILEKLDGSNFRFMLYDERYSDLYDSKDLKKFDVEDGDILFGSKKVVRGKLSSDNYDDVFKRVVNHLRNNLDKRKLKKYHDIYDSPLILYGEHMIPHTLDYDYNLNPPEPLLGFDVCKLKEVGRTPPNPYMETFKGFLNYEESKQLFEDIGLDFIVEVSKPSPPIDLNDIDIPLSNYGAVRAEGVIIRSDKLEKRIKYRSEEFKEKQKLSWGQNESDISTGDELISARYITNARIRKHIIQLYHDNKHLNPNKIAEKVVSDVWIEEWVEIKDIDMPIDTHRLQDKAIKRSKEVLENLQKNAELNNTTINSIWKDVLPNNISENKDKELEFDFTSYSYESINIDSDFDIETQILNELLDKSYIHKRAEFISEINDKPVGRWLIEKITNDLIDKIWGENISYFMNFPYPYNPQEINENLFHIVKNEIEGRDDVEINTKPENWNPDMSDVVTDGFELL